MNATPIDHRRLFAEMPVPRLLIRQDGPRRYVIVEANRQAGLYVGKSLDQLAGASINDVFDSENASHFLQSFEVCIKRKQPVTIQALPSIPGAMRIPGFWINPVFDEDGEILYLDMMGHADTTDRSILQRERDDAISLLTSIFDVSDIGILVTDHHRRVIRCNDSFVRSYGWPRDELIGRDFTELLQPAGREEVRATYGDFIRSGRRSSGEIEFNRKDGAVADALYTTAVIELSQKRRFQVMTVVDITLRKQMENSLRVAKEQADDANKAKSTFLANMSHELRTPLNAIIGFSEMMMKGTFGPLANPKYEEYMDDIHSSARHLLEIINEVLDMSKIEAGRLDLDEHVFSLRDMIHSVTRLMASKAFSNGLEIHEEMPEDLPPLLADPRLIKQILINLLTNAVKYTHSGGHISISSHILRTGEMQIIVADTGIGIPTDRIAEALEPFGQVNQPIDAKGIHGTGLGLPIAKAMVVMHGGTLEIESVVEKGTIVYVTLPKERVGAAAPSPAVA